MLIRVKQNRVPIKNLMFYNTKTTFNKELILGNRNKKLFFKIDFKRGSEFNFRIYRVSIHLEVD